MSDILNQTTVVLTSAQKNANTLMANVPALLKSLLQQRTAQYNLFWSDPINIAAALGNYATSLFQHDATLVSALTTFLTAQGKTGPEISAILLGIPAKYHVVFNANGSVTITEVVSAPSKKV
jgi:hypothetical protein